MTEGLSRRELLAWGVSAAAVSRASLFAAEPPLDTIASEGDGG